jgi:aconitate hydratase
MTSLYQKIFTHQGKSYHYTDLRALSDEDSLKKLPKSLKVLLENLARFKKNKEDDTSDIQQILVSPTHYKPHDIRYRPARVLMQDFTGVPAIVDLAAMRHAMMEKKGDVEKVNPLIPVDLVVDHSVSVDSWNNPHAYDDNVDLEYKRNEERYAFLKWAQKAFKNFRAVPPGTGICHQVNLEYLSQVVWVNSDHDTPLLYPDTLVGTDSHTTMVNGLSVLGWGVGGIEAEAAMLGQAVSMLIPEVVGVKLLGKLQEGVTATDLVLTLTHMLRAKGVVGKFVEFYGQGLDHLTLADRATISNMSPEFGATCAFFPIDQETLNYMHLTGRDEAHISLVEAYAKHQGFWREAHESLMFNDELSLDLSSVEPLLAGPKRPQDRLYLKDVSSVIPRNQEQRRNEENPVINGDVVIAAITSCTNTSNPSVMLGAGLMAKRAHALGLKAKPWVKCSLAPGSQVVSDYLQKADVMDDLAAIGFYLVGYGCTTCIGNSGPLSEDISHCIETNTLNVAAVLSGNRNFEGRIHPLVKSSFLASPMLVVAYALAGSTQVDIQTHVFGQTPEGRTITLKDLWPSGQEIQDVVKTMVTPDMFKTRYRDVFKGEKRWEELNIPDSRTYAWDANSTYVQHPPYFQDKAFKINNIDNARILALLGDSITTDHISPAGSIKADSPAGQYLQSKGVNEKDFNSYGSRRGNHEVMIRGTFANIRLQNFMTPEKQGGWSRIHKNEAPQPLYDVAYHYRASDTPMVVIAGKEYGTGSSRDWAAKGTRLLGINAVIAQSFERIHRSNLIGMGVLPLQFIEGQSAETLGLTGFETLSLSRLNHLLTPGMFVACTILYEDHSQKTIFLKLRVDTEDEKHYIETGGILPFVLDNLMA